MEEATLKLLATKPNQTPADIVYKNYHPISEQLQNCQIESDHLKEVKKMEEQYNQKIQRYIKEFTLADNTNINLVPKKPNSDLKRMISDTIEKLEKKTDRAIAESAADIYKAKQTTQ